MKAAPGAVASPCVNVCRMDGATGWCAGCLRTLDEIAGWSGYADAQKLRVWRQLPQRRLRWQLLGHAPLPPPAQETP